MSTAGRWRAPMALGTALAALAWTAACGGGGGGGGSSGPPVQTPPVSVSISPTSASLFLGTTQQFSASVTNATNTGVLWSVNGVPGGGPSTGTITSAGLYTAPQTLPSPATVTVTAASAQDPSRTASAMVTVMSDVNISVAPAMASVELGATQQFTATITATGNPSTAVSWSVENVAGGNPTVGTVSPTGLYTAPAILPLPSQVTVRATSLADPAKVASATVTLTATFSFAVSGPDEVVNGGQAQYVSQVTPVPGSAPNTAATWEVSGEDCSGAACGTIDANTGLYRAPTERPQPSSIVRITGFSVADPSKSAFMDVNITSGIAVFISPAEVMLATGASQQFSATVGGTANQGVNWSVAGASCTGAACGVITSGGLYTAPAAVPSPDDRVSVTATSAADPSATATATVRIGAGPVVQTLAPASVTAGAAGSFTLRVSGNGFSSSAVIIFNGSTRSSSCTTLQCTMTLNAADVAAPGARTVQVQTPSGGGTVFSNQVEFLVLAQPGPPEVIALTAGNPLAVNRDIVVVDPTTVGAGLPQIHIDGVGLFTSGTGCSISGRAIRINRAPAGEAVNVDVCIRGEGLAPTMGFSFSGPDDIQVLSADSPGLGTVRLTLRLTDSTQLGLRAVFVENTNKEKAALSGAIEVKAP